MLRRVRRIGGIAALLAISASVMAASAATSQVNGPALALKQAERKMTSVGTCPVFPLDNPWNTPIDNLPLRARSAETIAKIQSVGGDFLHPDFGENPDYGIPFVIVPAGQPLVPVTYDGAGDESDPGPFPIPADAPVESGSDSHVLVVQEGTCRLYELFAASRTTNGWRAYSGARFDLTSNALRPLGWTSADAAGLPILPGLVRYEEVARGRITHAIRVTFSQTQRKYILPATHYASDRSDVDLPPMGLRLRLRGDYDISQFTGQARVIAVALQRYGFIVADNGSNWFFQGAPSPGWNDDELDQLKSLSGAAFEVVDTGPTLPG